jgi:hypothetical protein
LKRKENGRTRVGEGKRGAQATNASKNDYTRFATELRAFLGAASRIFQIFCGRFFAFAENAPFDFLKNVAVLCRRTTARV